MTRYHRIEHAIFLIRNTTNRQGETLVNWLRILSISVFLSGCATQNPRIVQTWTSPNGFVETSVHRTNSSDGSKTFTWIVTNKYNAPFCIMGEVKHAVGAANIDHDRVVVVFPGASLPFAKLTSIPGEKVGWSFIATELAWFGEGGVACRLTTEPKFTPPPETVWEDP